MYKTKRAPILYITECAANAQEVNPVRAMHLASDETKTCAYK